MGYYKIPCMIIRGGTSKGVFFHDRDLPPDPKERDRVILAAFGSPDTRQIDGLGGADPLTSKVAIIKASARPGVDIDYTFGQVGINEVSINYSLNCGNISSGAAIFAVDEGLVRIEEPVTTVKIFNTNTNTLISAKVRVEGGRAATIGDFSIDGVPGKGAMIELTFLETAGATTGKLLPTGNAVDEICISHGKRTEVSIIDAGNLYIFVDAREVGLEGTEHPEEIERRKDLFIVLEEIFKVSAQKVNEALGYEKNKVRIDKLALVGRQGAHRREDAEQDSPPVDFVSRIVTSNGKVHKAYAVTGAISAGFCAFVKGSVVERILVNNSGKELRIGHPQGVIDIAIECEPVNGQLVPSRAVIRRTARRIMDGYVYVNKSDK